MCRKSPRNKEHLPRYWQNDATVDQIHSPTLVLCQAYVGGWGRATASPQYCLAWGLAVARPPATRTSRVDTALAAIGDSDFNTSSRSLTTRFVLEGAAIQYILGSLKAIPTRRATSIHCRSDGPLPPSDERSVRGNQPPHRSPGWLRRPFRWPSW